MAAKPIENSQTGEKLHKNWENINTSLLMSFGKIELESECNSCNTGMYTFTETCSDRRIVYCLPSLLALRRQKTDCVRA